MEQFPIGTEWRMKPEYGTGSFLVKAVGEAPSTKICVLYYDDPKNERHGLEQQYSHDDLERLTAERVT